MKQNLTLSPVSADQVVPGEQSVPQHDDDFDFAGLVLDDDWDPMQHYTTTTTAPTAAAAPPMRHTTDIPPPASRPAPPQHDHSCAPTHVTAQGTTETPPPGGCSAQPHHIASAAAAVTDSTRLVTPQAGGGSGYGPIPSQQVCMNGDSAPTDNLPRQQEQQQQGQQPDHQEQLQGCWQQPPEPQLAPVPVSGDSSPGCTLVFDIDSDSDHLPESAPVTQQWRQRFEHDGSQPKKPQGNQQQQQALNHNRHGFAISEACIGGQPGFDTNSNPAKQARQLHQQQHSNSNQQVSGSWEAQPATDAFEGCRLVFDIDPDPEDLSEHPLQQVTWQPTGVSHGGSDDSWPPDHCRVSMNQHESRLAGQQPLGVVDGFNAEDISHCYHPQGSSSVSHQAQYHTPGLRQHGFQFLHPSLIAQNPQTPNTMHSPQQQLTLGLSENSAGAWLQHSSSDPQVSPPAQHDVPMQDEVTNGYRPGAAAEQLASWAAAARDDDSCPLVFEDEEEELDIMQEEEEELGGAQGWSGRASPGLQHEAEVPAVAPEGVHPNPNPDPMPLSHPHPRPHPHPQPQCSRQQQPLHGMTHHSPSWSDSMQPQHEHDSCPLIFTPETDKEQHITTGAEHTTEQAHLAPGKGQFQQSPQCAAKSPAQSSQTGMPGDCIRSADQSDHMAAHVTGHMAGGVCNMYQQHTQHSTDPQESYMCESGGNMASCDDAHRAAPEASIHSWHRNHAADGCDTQNCAEVGFVPIQLCMSLLECVRGERPGAQWLGGIAREGGGARGAGGFD